MTKRTLMILLAAAISGYALLSPLQASATTLDQSYNPYVTLEAPVTNLDWWGQSFTAGITGSLDKVGTLIFQEPGTTSNLQFTLFPIINNQALVSQGISMNIPNFQIPVGYGVTGKYSLADMMTIDLSQYNFQVVAGSEYGMLVHSSNNPVFSAVGYTPTSTINWLGGCVNNQIVQCNVGNATYDGYARGSPLQTYAPLINFAVSPRTDSDLAFATYVTAVPEPSEYMLMLMGLGLTGYIARRRKDKAQI